MLKVLGKKPVDIKDNEYMILSDVGNMEKPLEQTILENRMISVNNKELTPAKGKKIGRAHV